MVINSAFVKVSCDKCHDYDEDVELTALGRGGSWDERNVVRHLEKSGWKIEGEYTHICPDCAGEDDWND